MTSVNPRWLTDPGAPDYRINCQRAVQAYELRRRGNDVQAQPNRPGDEDMGPNDFGRYWTKPDGTPAEFDTWETTG